LKEWSAGGDSNSLPLPPELGTHTVTVPIANYDNNQHSANENIRMQNFWGGIETMAALEAMK